MLTICLVKGAEVAAGTAKLLGPLGGRGRCMRGFGVKIGPELVVAAAGCDVIGKGIPIGAPAGGPTKLMLVVLNGVDGIAVTTELVETLGTCLFKGSGPSLDLSGCIPLVIGTLPVLLDFGTGNGLGMNIGATLLFVAVGID